MSSDQYFSDHFCETDTLIALKRCSSWEVLFHLVDAYYLHWVSFCFNLISESSHVCVSAFVCNRLPNYAYFSDETFTGDSMGLG